MTCISLSFSLEAKDNFSTGVGIVTVLTGDDGILLAVIFAVMLSFIGIDEDDDVVAFEAVIDEDEDDDDDDDGDDDDDDDDADDDGNGKVTCRLEVLAGAETDVEDDEVDEDDEDVGVNGIC